MGHDVAWWTAFGAIAQALGALATFAAVAVSLGLARSERSLRGNGRARIMALFEGDGSPGVYVVHFDLENTGLRPLTWQSVSWRVGWTRWDVWGLGYAFAIQNFTVGMFEQKQVVEPSHTGSMSMPLTQLKAAIANDHKVGRAFFRRVHPIFGDAPIAAYAQVAGRKNVKLRVSPELARFLRTGDHPNTTAEGSLS